MQRLYRKFQSIYGYVGNRYTISGKAGNEQHIWNVVKSDDDWYALDVTWDDPVGGSQEYIDHSYFNISDSDMAIDHHGHLISTKLIQLMDIYIHILFRLSFIQQEHNMNLTLYIKVY